MQHKHRERGRRSPSAISGSTGTTGVRAEKGRSYLTERDRLALTWIGEQYVVCTDQLQQLLGRWALSETKEAGWLSLPRTRILIRRFEQAGWVRAQRMHADYPAWVWLTAVGMSQVSLPYSRYTPKVGELLHAYGINQVRLHVEQAEPGGQWISERSLRREAAGHRKQKRPHVPDGEWVPHAGERIAIEVERTYKSRKRLSGILEELCLRYPKIWYVVEDALFPFVSEQVATLALAEQITCLRLSSFAGASPQGAEPC